MARPYKASAGGTEELVASAARTTTGDSGTVTGWEFATVLRVQLDVTAASGTTPTLDVIVADTLDGTNWNTIGTFTQKVTTGRQVIDISALFAETIRVNWIIAGTTPSFTFSVRAYGR